MNYHRGGRWYILHVDSFLRSTRLAETVAEGPCLECFGIPHGSQLFIDLARAPQIGDFAAIETPEVHEVTGSRLQCKKLGIARVRDKAANTVDVATCESVGPPYYIDGRDRLLGTVVAVIVPLEPIVDDLFHAMNRHTDAFIAQFNALRPLVNWRRRPPVSAFQQSLPRGSLDKSQCFAAELSSKEIACRAP